jgi:hypothetical protein
MTQRRDEPARDSADGVAADGDGSDDNLSPDSVAETELPVRPAPDSTLRRSIRRMDDPEILERVLAGLLDLA